MLMAIDSVKGSQDEDVTHEERVYGVHAMCCVMSLLSDVQVEQCNNSANGTSTLNPVLQGCHRSHKSFRSPGAPLYNRVIHEVEDMVRQWPVTQRWGVKTRMSPTMSCVSGVPGMCCVSSFLSSVQVERCNNSVKG